MRKNYVFDITLAFSSSYLLADDTFSMTRIVPLSQHMALLASEIASDTANALHLKGRYLFAQSAAYDLWYRHSGLLCDEL